MYKPRILLFDLDGVLIDCSERAKRHVDIEALESGDYNRYVASFNDFSQTVDGDCVILEGVELYQILLKGVDAKLVGFLTARCESSTRMTQEFLQPYLGDIEQRWWFRKQRIPDELGLFWREGDSLFSPAEYKREMIRQIQQEYEIVLAIDDHPDICRMYQEEGIPNLQFRVPNRDCLTIVGDPSR